MKRLVLNMAKSELLYDLIERLHEIGINNGDIVYVSSDIRYYIYSIINEIGESENSINDALNRLTDTLQATVGCEGTLLFPVFSFDFCKGKGFNYFTTQGETGTYSNWILNNRKDFRRTQHPMYSFMVWGKKAELFCNMSNQDAWGEASPFYYIYKNDGKQLEFNAESYKGLTFIHCFEQWVKVPYRHHKYFYGKYTNADGHTEVRMYSMYVRHLSVDEHTKTTNQYLINAGVAVEAEWKKNRLTVVDIGKCYDVVKEDIVNNNGYNNLEFTDYIFQYGTKQMLPFEVSDIPIY